MVKISPELAEICGIHAGDGYFRFNGKSGEVDISGNVEEKCYYDTHVIPLFNKVLDLNVTGKLFPYRNTYGFVVRDKKVLQLFKEIGFPSGNKSTIIEIPGGILNSNNTLLYKRFLRGYLDTDGCINFDKKVTNSSLFQKTRNYYPRLLFTTCSSNLAKGFKYVTELLGFKTYFYPYRSKVLTENIKYTIQITGFKAFDMWMKLIGSKNPTKLSRYLIWQKFGFCPPNTTYKKRLKILSGHLDPNQLYGPVV
ncbi:MAG: LAGLIDADG family homing endonuclease [Candidatus Woesearchaeota archaeon]